MMMKNKNKGTRKSFLCSLPQDLLVQVTAHLGCNSSAPIDDIKSLRATCKQLHEASKARRVGRLIAVCKERDRRWDKIYANNYFRILENCADSGNLDASFLLGVDHIYSLRLKGSGLGHLQRAVDGGHCAAAYFLGIMLCLDPSTQSDGMDLLNKVSSGDLSSNAKASECTRSGNAHILRCRREAVAAVQCSWRTLRLEARPRCANTTCGRVVESGKDEQWRGEDGLHRSFCSQFCRWKHEVHTFFERV